MYQFLRMIDLCMIFICVKILYWCCWLDRAFPVSYQCPTMSMSHVRVVILLAYRDKMENQRFTSDFYRIQNLNETSNMNIRSRLKEWKQKQINGITTPGLCNFKPTQVNTIKPWSNREIYRTEHFAICIDAQKSCTLSTPTPGFTDHTRWRG